MDTLDNIVERMQVCKLESRLVLREIEREHLTREIEAQVTTPERRTQAIERRDELQSEWREIFAELQAVRRVHRTG